jgi:hypothetical protein
MNDRQNSFETCSGQNYLQIYNKQFMTCLGRLLFIDNNNINFAHNWCYLNNYENTLGPLSIIRVGPYVKKGLPPFLSFVYI